MRLLTQLAILGILVALRPVIEPPEPVVRTAISVDPEKLPGFTVAWEGTSARYIRRGDVFVLDEPARPPPSPSPSLGPVSPPDPGAPSFDGLSSPIPAEERRRMRMDRLSRNLLGSLTHARLIELTDPLVDGKATGLATPTGRIHLDSGGPGLEVGGPTPSQTGHYARTLPEGKLLILPLTTVSTLRQLARAEFPAPQF